MMDNPRITLAIFGNQNSNSGFQPLYWINNPVQPLENLIPPGMEENSYFFVLETGEKFTQYTLVQNHVSSYMSVRPGALKMAIGIPNGYRLANDESPLTVLMAVQDTFLKECMTQKSSLSETRNFKQVLPDEQLFKSIVDGYSLIPSYDRVYPMQGADDAVLLLPSAQMADFFRNVHYPELQGYKKVVIGEKGNTTVYPAVVSDLQIPLPMTPPPAPPKPQPKPQPEPQMAPQPVSTKPQPVSTTPVNTTPVNTTPRPEPMPVTQDTQSTPQPTRPQSPQSTQSTQSTQQAPVVKTPSVPLPDPTAERIYMDVGEKTSIIGPIIKFVVVPILAFLFGLLVTFLVSLFINKDEVETTTDESNVEAVSPTTTPNPQPRIVTQEGDGNEVETTQESDNDEEGEMSDVSDGTNMSDRIGQTSDNEQTSDKEQADKEQNANTRQDAGRGQQSGSRRQTTPPANNSQNQGDTPPMPEYGTVKKK